MAGIYIHIPFCKQKCTYCDFHFSTRFSSYRDEMLKSMLKEIELNKEYVGNETIETIYFGGGTPSLLKSEEIKYFIDCIYQHFQVSEFSEITLEANPDDISYEKVLTWKEIGINRLSIGVQSFDEKDLTWMNRAHTATESLECVKNAQQAGIDNISIDLIYGLPNMDVARWKKQVQKAIQLDVKHISAYCLTVEEKTALNHLVQKGKLIPAHSDLQVKHFEILQHELKIAGFEHYEISNFAKQNYISKHNSSYWLGKKYLGIGPSAHSFDGKSRKWNISNNPAYIKEINRNGDYFEIERLTSKDRFNELILTGLRTKWGVSLNKLHELYPFSNEFEDSLSQFIHENHVQIIDNQIVLTDSGKNIADYVAQTLFIC
jgi:oxygen-independent coproporphyrinogen III oxidase